MSVNKAASIRARLKTVADKERRPFDFILMLYFIERLLYRLSISRYQDAFVLKGGLLLYSILNEKARPTKDVDLLARALPSDMERLKQIFIEIASIHADDAVAFDIDSISVERIKEDADYEGVRIKLIVRMQNIRTSLQFDIGFGDIVVPKPQMMEYPTLLDMERPLIKAYSMESVIAEKFETMLFLAEANSRMKDFYDIYNLSENFPFDGPVLYEAILQTLRRRGTVLSEAPVAFTEAFAENKDKQIQWQAFKRRTQIKQELEFAETVGSIKRFLLPIYECVLHEDPFIGQWSLATRQWSYP
ncbi:MAG: nucleotidyl transferase AbiEii/AbiGii toxin family protein [Oscillospiraceae bacterium]|jgi:predicted nucleotidyltransferase component of viral defense system|nr:nucleotidyl transferase AbiEii/AbiGii toxin family protein [Oscillospiraceae bacterium]